MALRFSLITGIERMLHYDSYLQITPLEWKRGINIFIKVDFPWSRFWRKIGLLLCCIFSTLMLIECFKKDSMYTDLSQRFLAGSSASAIVFNIGTVWIMHTEYPTIIMVLNGILELENNFEIIARPGRIQRRNLMLIPTYFKVRFITALNNVFVWTVNTGPVFFAMSSVIDPTWPTNVLAGLGGFEEQGNGILMSLMKGVNGVVNLVFWRFLFTVGALFQMQMLLIIVCTNGYQQALIRVHSVQRYAHLSLGYLRRIQLLLQLFNKVYSNIIVCLLFVLSFIQIVAVYMTVLRISGKLEIPLAVLVVTVIEVVDSYMVILAIYGIAGKVNKTCKLVKSKLANKDTNSTTKERKTRRLTLKSIPDLKIKFAAVNFIEENTCLMFLDFNVGRVVDLLLLD
ncbi:unnamed protein product [Orchesella dallaii]|uniref:Odorant receptor n=1 Tax=Orchesella dallaii TaxID=48710 RepID=A0ABP1PNP7_9HEXA